MPFKATLFSILESIRASYWFVPTLMSVGAAGLSVGMVWLDATVAGQWVGKVPWLYTGTATGARTLLATIGSSMVGLAGVVFSITIVALTLASGQFGARLLRNFMRDRGNQITLGTFLAAFLFCLLILRKIQDSTDPSGDVFVPQLSMLMAVLLSIAGLGVLIYFIHHAATSIQAPHVIAAVAADLRTSIETIYPEKIGLTTRNTDLAERHLIEQVPPRFDQEALAVTSEREGYIQRIEAEELLEITIKHDLVIKIARYPGEFIYRDVCIMQVWPASRVDEQVVNSLRKTLAVNDQRSIAQDAGFAIEQLVEVAVRALSPGINDPFTAVQCIDRLTAGLAELSSRKLPSQYRMDEDQKLRVIAKLQSFESFFDLSFCQIQQYAAESLDVLIAMLVAFGRLAPHLEQLDHRRCLNSHVRIVQTLAASAAKSGKDRDRINAGMQPFSTNAAETAELLL